MRMTFCLILLAHSLFAQQYRLAPPKIRCEQVFFENNTEVRLFFDLKGARIRYTLDGTEPTALSALYKKPIRVNKDVRLRARVFHADYLPSEIAALDVFRRGTPPVPPLRLGHAPADEYGGAASNYDRLIDGKTGSDDLHDGAWIGLSGKPLDVYATWKKEQQIRVVKLSTLTNTGAWIFPPTKISLYVAGEDAQYRLVKEEVLTTPGNSLKPEEGRHTYVLRFPPERCTRVCVVAEPWGNLPDWHPGKGAPAWLFVDEIAFE
jgi:hypothetical protein